MKTSLRLHLAALLLATFTCLPASAQEGRSSHIDSEGNELIHHRVNDQGQAYSGYAPTVAGSC